MGWHVVLCRADAGPGGVCSRPVHVGFPIACFCSRILLQGLLYILLYLLGMQSKT